MFKYLIRRAGIVIERNVVEHRHDYTPRRRELPTKLRELPAFSTWVPTRSSDGAQRQYEQNHFATESVSVSDHFFMDCGVVRSRIKGGTLQAPERDRGREDQIYKFGKCIRKTLRTRSLDCQAALSHRKSDKPDIIDAGYRFLATGRASSRIWLSS